jgi:signal transduction histidine kinase/ligand-binding sensor domain-containing protein
MKDGLSENSIRCIIEDKTGFMWFGTEDGINRFDGYEFKQFRSNYQNDFSLSSGHIKSFFLDQKGYLWICTRDGVNLFDHKKEKFYNYKNLYHKAFRPIKGDIEMMTQDMKGNYYIAGNDQGLFKISDLDKECHQFKINEKGLSSIITFLCFVDDENMLVGTQDGVYNFNVISERFTSLKYKYGKDYQVKHIYHDTKSGLTFLSTSVGLKIIYKNGITKTFTHDPEDPFSMIGNNVIQVTSFKNGNFLVGVDGSGIDYFDIKKEKFYHYTCDNESQLSANNVTCLFVDSKTDLWVGTFLNGINFSNNTTNLFVLIKNNTGNNHSIKKGIVSDFLIDKNKNFWITTDGGGIYKRKLGENHFENYTGEFKPNSLSSNAVTHCSEDNEGHVYFTTYGGGLCMYNEATNDFTVYKRNPEDSNSIYEDKLSNVHYYDNRIWVGGYGTGLSVFNKTSKQWKIYHYNPNDEHSLPSEWVHTFLTDCDGTLWLGTFGGISKYNPETDNFTTYHLGKDKFSNERNFILDMTEDYYGNIWIGSSGGGLILFNKKNGKYEFYTIKDGLSENTVKSVIEDNNGDLWLATNDGITKFNINRKKAKSYTIKDGVPASAFYFRSKYKDEKGKIYFGTNNGYLIINPNLTKTNPHVPPVVITKLKILNEIVSPNDKNSILKESISEVEELILSHKQNSISFEFAALNFNNGKNNKYSYKLQGFDNNWVNTDFTRTATYTNLNPGKYVFKVRASNNDNVWNNDGRSISIIIEPPFYLTWYFIVFMILLFTGSLYLIYLWRVQNIKIKTIQLEDTVRIRTKELKDANEQLETFVYKASHDIKGPLKSIIGLTTVGQKDVQDATANVYFDHILKSTRKLDNLLMDLLEITKVKQATIKLEKIDFKELITEAVTRFENLPDFHHLKIKTNLKGNIDYTCDKFLMFSIIQNLIENAIKYRDPLKEENHLDIEIQTSVHGVEMIFSDNGPGIPDEFQEKIFDMFMKVNENSNGTGLGLYIVKTTVEKLNGTLKLESNLGEGTTFIIKLPLQK